MKKSGCCKAKSSKQLQNTSKDSIDSSNTELETRGNEDESEAVTKCSRLKKKEHICDETTHADIKCDNAKKSKQRFKTKKGKLDNASHSESQGNEISTTGQDILYTDQDKAVKEKHTDTVRPTSRPRSDDKEAVHDDVQRKGKLRHHAAVVGIDETKLNDNSRILNKAKLGEDKPKQSFVSRLLSWLPTFQPNIASKIYVQPIPSSKLSEPVPLSGDPYCLFDCLRSKSVISDITPSTYFAPPPKVELLYNTEVLTGKGISEFDYF